MFSGLVKIVKFENLWALYKGNGAQMVRIFPYAATQFTSYEVYKPIFGNMMSQHHFSKFLSGSAAGITAVLLTYPLDTIRARLAFQITGEHKYSGITHTAITMFKEVIENVSYPRIGSFLVLLINRKEEVRLYIEALHPLL